MNAVEDRMLATAVETRLKAMGASAPVLLAKARADKIYEIFVLTCLAKALRSLGARLTPCDANGAPTSRLTFRLGPGLLYGPSSSPSYIRVDYKGAWYEIQNSVRVLGASGVLHELDVCLLSGREAEECRKSGIDPSHSATLFLAECKYYGSGLPLHLGREYLGLSREFGLRVKVLVSNRQSEDVRKLVKRHRGTNQFSITPLRPGNVDTFVKWLEGELRQVLP